jgi:hypothetical protein
MMTRTDCDVQFARHSRHIATSNQLGWLYDDQQRATTTSVCLKKPSRLSRLVTRLRPAHRPLAAVSH